jgi:hypothetical protein
MDKNTRQDNKISHEEISTSDLFGVGWSDKSLQDFLKIGSSVRSINDYSAGLSFAMPDNRILGDYTAILNSQKMALDSISQISENFKFQNNQLVSLMGDTVLPVTNVMADIGLASANAMKLYGVGLINNEQFKLAQGISGIAINTIGEYQDTLNKGWGAIKKSGILQIADGIRPSLRVVGSGISEMMRSLPTFPTSNEIIFPSLEITREVSKVSREEISEYQSRLDELLYDIDPDLIEFRKAVWVTFNGRGKDYIGQSSSSMRRLIDNLIRSLAPQDEVIKTNFFQTSTKAKDDKGRPTRKARILYLVDWDRNKAEHLMRIIDGFLETYDNLSAWDHTPIKKHDFVRGTLIAIEGYLLSMLTVNKDK